MKRTRKRGPKNDERFDTAKNDTNTAVVEEEKVVIKLTCNHCGGMLKSTPDGTTCFMCGRDKSHRCDNCQNGGEGVAA